MFLSVSLGGTQAHTLGTVISFKSPKNSSEQQDTKPNQFNKGLKRKHSLKTKYEQEKKSTYTKIAQTKNVIKQSQTITAQFNPKHLLLVVGIDR